MDEDVNRRILLVTPVRDEASHLGRVIRQVVDQALRPAMWILMDDHSRDGSFEICSEAACRYPWIKAIRYAGREVERQLGTHVYEVVRSAYEHGIDLCRQENIDYGYLGLLDADMFPDADYFERLMAVLERNPEMGIVSGGVYVTDMDGDSVWEESPIQWPRGGARVWSRKCFEETGGISIVNAADAVSAIRAIHLGYGIRQIREVRVIQSRATGTATGIASGFFQKGVDDHFLGYSLVYACAKSVLKCHERGIPAGISYLMGHLSALINRRKRIDDPYVRDFCHQRLRRRLGLLRMSNGRGRTVRTIFHSGLYRADRPGETPAANHAVHLQTRRKR